MATSPQVQTLTPENRSQIEARTLFRCVGKNGDTVEKICKLIAVPPEVETVLRLYVNRNPEEAAGIERVLEFLIPIGEGHFRRAVTEFVAHYHRERNHQGLENALIEGAPISGAGRVLRQSRLGGLLNFYKRA